MVKKKTIFQIMMILVIIGFALFIGFTQLAVSSFSFNWKGIMGSTVFSSPGSVSGGGSWSGTVTGIDSDSPIVITSTSSSGSAGGGAATASVIFEIEDISTLDRIFLDIDGGVTGTDQALASAKLSIRQDTVSLIEVGMEKGAFSEPQGSFPSGLLLNFEDGFVTIPTPSATFTLDPSMNLVFSFTTSANTIANHRSAEGRIFIDDIHIFRKAPICQEGQIQDCVINGEIGTRECVNNIWTECKAKQKSILGTMLLILGGIIIILLIIFRKKIIG